ncbi:MAG: class I SAM-dependent methyltransferase [Desulfomonile tiedjei]|uniref:Class I SAM-dependent methyltransferase n=1 Tax=Desulfomonile tiedjei TaxID=2358 RepID=A0A9D6V3G9_9BACT|nr:class I SAM-dependent methyltransferase [Desulfomonile tiedjei]
MPEPQEYTFARYLSSKKSVDDRSLNKSVWERLAAEVSSGPETLRVLELGSGIGTMVERAIDWGLLKRADYTCVDSQSENTAEVFGRLPNWAIRRNYEYSADRRRIRLSRGNSEIFVKPVTADVLEFMENEENKLSWDLLIANAFLDLVDVPAVLPHLFSMLKPGGMFYFTINFDGATILQPEIQKALDSKIELLYHRTMDQRVIKGRLSGDSRTGRHFFQHAREAGAEILEAGPSDWVVFAGSKGYREDEAYFLHFIVHTMGLALSEHPELDSVPFGRWIEDRHRQIEEGRLVYIAHQIDFFGRIAG